MENMTQYSTLDLFDWMNILLDSVQVLKLGSETYNTVTLLGKPPEKLIASLSEKDSLKTSFIGNKSKFLVSKNGIWTFTPIKQENHFESAKETPVQHLKTSFDNSSYSIVPDELTIDAKPKITDLNDERYKRKLKRHHLNNVSDTIEKMHMASIKPNINRALRLNRSASYKSIERSRSTNLTRTIAKDNMRVTYFQPNEALRWNVNLDSKRSSALIDTWRTKMKSVSPTRNLQRKDLEASHQSIVKRTTLAKEKTQNRVLRVFELKNIKFTKLKQSPPSSSKQESKVAKDSDFDNGDKVVTRLRSLRYKSINHSSSEDLYADTSQQEKRENESFRSEASPKYSNQRNWAKMERKISSYSSNIHQNSIMTNDQTEIKFCPRRKQPRQTKLYHENSRDCEEEKVTESDEEADAITNEDLGENSSKEAPFRQRVNETRPTIKFMQINSEGNIDHEFESVDPDHNSWNKSLEENYQGLIHYEPRFENVTNHYKIIKSSSFASKIYDPGNNENQNIMSQNDLDLNSSPISKTYTKPLALRKRNREPYNPFSQNNQYLYRNRFQNLASSEYNQQENLPRTTWNKDTFEYRQEFYMQPEHRSYYRSMLLLATKFLDFDFINVII